MDLKSHVAISTGLGIAVWGATQSVPAAATTLAVGVLIDTDHLLELWRWHAKKDHRHFYVLLHAWEYFALLALIYSLGLSHPVFLGALVGYGGHMIADSLKNHLHPLGYLLTYRLANGFKIEKIAPDKSDFSLESVYKTMPLGRFIVPIVLTIMTVLAGIGQREERQ